MAASQKVFLRALIWVMVYVCPRFRSLCRSHLVNKTHRFGLIRPDDRIYTTNVEANSEKRGGGGGAVRQRLNVINNKKKKIVTAAMMWRHWNQKPSGSRFNTRPLQLSKEAITANP